MMGTAMEAREIANSIGARKIGPRRRSGRVGAGYWLVRCGDLLMGASVEPQWIAVSGTLSPGPCLGTLARDRPSALYPFGRAFTRPIPLAEIPGASLAALARPTGPPSVSEAPKPAVGIDS
jgi:hypothetical protein